MARTKKTGVIIAIQVMLNISENCRFPSASDLVTATALESGRKICAKICSISGKDVKGKNVPLSRNIGVMKRNPG
jgi:hypothetical protein